MKNTIILRLSRFFRMAEESEHNFIEFIVIQTLCFAQRDGDSLTLPF